MYYNGSRSLIDLYNPIYELNFDVYALFSSLLYDKYSDGHYMVLVHEYIPLRASIDLLKTNSFGIFAHLIIFSHRGVVS